MKRLASENGWLIVPYLKLIGEYRKSLIMYLNPQPKRENKCNNMQSYQIKIVALTALAAWIVCFIKAETVSSADKNERQPIM